MAATNSRSILYSSDTNGTVVNRTNQPYRIYKPLFLDENQIVRDLDREFESISQALIWVTSSVDTIVDNLNVLLVKAGITPITLSYPDQK